MRTEKVDQRANDRLVLLPVNERVQQRTELSFVEKFVIERHRSFGIGCLEMFEIVCKRTRSKNNLSSRTNHLQVGACSLTNRKFGSSEDENSGDDVSASSAIDLQADGFFSSSVFFGSSSSFSVVTGFSCSFVTAPSGCSSDAADSLVGFAKFNAPCLTTGPRRVA